MLQVKNFVPTVYYNESRDFQLLGRLYDILFNSVKTHADLLYQLPFSSSSADELLELWALTLGLKPNNNFNTNQLRAICAVFPTLLRTKGSIAAIKTACKALFYAEGNTSDVLISEQRDSQGNLTGIQIFVPTTLHSVTLLQHLLDYILPAGLSCSIISSYVTDESTPIQLHTNMNVVNYYYASTPSESENIRDINELATVFEPVDPDTGKDNIQAIAGNKLMLDGKSLSGTVGLGRVYVPKKENNI